MSLVCSWNEVGISYVQVSSSFFWRMPIETRNNHASFFLFPLVLSAWPLLQIVAVKKNYFVQSLGSEKLLEKCR